MQVDIRVISRDIGSSVEVNLNFRPEDTEIEFRDFRFLHPVVFTGTATSIFADAIVLTGKVSTTVGATCVRCLEEVEILVLEEVEVIFRSDFKPNNHDNKDVEGLEDEYTYHGFTIHPDQAIIDSIILALPLKVLCSEDCKGIKV